MNKAESNKAFLAAKAPELFPLPPRANLSCRDRLALHRLVCCGFDVLSRLEQRHDTIELSILVPGRSAASR
jgi:hypothetical protein